jgi:RNA polymerase sigma factor (sigma-70 family)
MSFNKGYELKKFEAHWEKLRIEYAAAGMTEEAIQKMYDYDRQQFNSERTFIERTQEFTAPAYESSEEEASPLMLRYQDAITVTDTYHETKSRFAWIGEIENERLLSALENLSEDDLKLLTFYAYEGYTVTEISKVLGVSQPTISIKIKRVTNFLKKFDFDAMD